MRLLLDEHFSPEIARQLRALGHDVDAARERADVRGLADRALLGLARSEGRAVVTENVADFAALHAEAIVRGDHHPGIVFTSPLRFPRRRRAIGRLVRALAELLAGTEDLEDRTWWL